MQRGWNLENLECHVYANYEDSKLVFYLNILIYDGPSYLMISVGTD